MKIWLTRHGQTNLNSARVMQGRIDEPLNETGREQAREVRDRLRDVKFDAVYASYLGRAVETASIIADIPANEIIKDDRIVEFSFGHYENREFKKLGPAMWLYWLLPELFPTPKTVESIPTAIKRVKSFVNELKTKDYENVLVVCHGGIIRVIKGVLEGKRNSIVWRPKPQNCEIKVYEI